MRHVPLRFRCRSEPRCKSRWFLIFSSLHSFITSLYERYEDQIHIHFLLHLIRVYSRS